MIDSHCHLTDAQFEGDRAAVLQRAWDAGLTSIITIASNLSDARAALQLARTDARVRCTAGIHPHEAAGADEPGFADIQELLREHEVVAVGETGLDFHYDNAPRATQRRVFERQLQLAADLDMPIVVHSRSADEDTAAMIRDASVTGVLHCFAGGTLLFDAGMEAGWFISFGGMITFRNFDNAPLLQAAPADRLLLETDSPYLAPVPFRGRRNEPAHILEIAHAAAAIRSAGVEELAAVTAANARRFYRLEAVAAGP